MATKKAPTQAEAVEQVKEVSTSLWNPNDKPDMVDPIIYRDDYKTENITSGYDPKKLANANINLSKYGDDSSLNNSSNPDTVWGMSGKYTGQWTSNTFVNYDANMTLDKLDPAYKYWQDAEMQNSREANYIAKRNDSIASALYNAGKKSMEDVAEFLNQQEWFRNSYEEARQNTIMSIWKRIWDIEENNDKDKTELEVKEMEAEKKAEPKWQNVNVNTFLQGSTTELFGKMITWADTAPYDHNSTEWLQAEARLKQYERVNALSVDQLASNIKSWSILAGWQAMRDLQAYNPEKYKLLQEYQKKEEALDQINMIASGNFTDGNTNLQDQTGNSINNYLNETVANAGLDANARMDLDTALSQNQWIINYAEKMSYYQAQINQLDQTIGNLAEDARRQLSKSMGENVPEYMIQNYINNRSKKLYKQRDNLMNQYNYYKGVYEAQVEQEASAWERDYKERQLQIQQDKADWDKAYDLAKLWWEKEKYKSDMDYKTNEQLRKTYWDLNTYTDSWMKGKGLKNNNPWNIKDTTFGAIIGTDGSGFAIFETPEDGFDALVEKIKFNQTNPKSKYYWKTIAEYFKLYAPDSDGNNSTAYANSVAKQLWVSVDTPISKLDPTKFASVIAKHDSGYDYSTYGNFRGKVAKKKTSSKEEVTYTNDELFTQLRGGKIDYKNFLKNWNGEEPQTEIDDWIWKTYFDKKPMMTLSNMWDSVKELWKMLWDDVVAEHYTLDHLNQNKNISNDKVVKIVSEYVTDTNKWLKEADKISISEYLAEALAWRYGTYDEVKKALDDSKIDYKELTGKKSKQIAKEIIAEWGIED